MARKRFSENGGGGGGCGRAGEKDLKFVTVYNFYYCKVAWKYVYLECVACRHMFTK